MPAFLILLLLGSWITAEEGDQAVADWLATTALFSLIASVVIMVAIVAAIIIF